MIRSLVESHRQSRYWIGQRLQAKGLTSARQRLDSVLAGKTTQLRRDFVEALAKVLKVEYETLLLGGSRRVPPSRPPVAATTAHRLWKDLTRRGKRDCPLPELALEALLSFDRFYYYLGDSSLPSDEPSRGQWDEQFAKGMAVAIRALCGAWVLGEYEFREESLDKLYRALNTVRRRGLARSPRVRGSRAEKRRLFNEILSSGNERLRTLHLLSDDALADSADYHWGPPLGRS
jgi:hypothetical protein